MAAPQRYFTPTGESFLYRSVGDRVKLFLERYPFKDGYRTTMECFDELAIQPMLMELVKVAIGNGHAPESVGLGKINTTIRVCRCRLYLGETPVVERHARGQVVGEKDLEILETAAFQRLMAACDVGGEVFDEDERRDMQGQGITSAPATPQPESAPARQAPAEPHPDPTVKPSPEGGELSYGEPMDDGRNRGWSAASADNVDLGPETRATAAEEQSGASGEATAENRGKEPLKSEGEPRPATTERSCRETSERMTNVGVPPAMLRSIRMAATSKGLEYTEPMDLEEAKSLLLALRKGKPHALIHERAAV